MRYSTLALVLALAPLATQADAAMPRRGAMSLTTARSNYRNLGNGFRNNRNRAAYDVISQPDGTLIVTGNSSVTLPNGTVLHGTDPDLYWPPYIWNANNWCNNGWRNNGWCNNHGWRNNGWCNNGWRNNANGYRTAFRNIRNRH